MGMGYRRGPQRGGFGSPGLLNPQVVSIFTNLFLQVRADDHVHVMCSRAPVAVSGSWCCYSRGNQVCLVSTLALLLQQEIWSDNI